jgi:hypothetical protein
LEGAPRRPSTTRAWQQVPAGAGRTQAGSSPPRVLRVLSLHWIDSAALHPMAISLVIEPLCEHVNSLAGLGGPMARSYPLPTTSLTPPPVAHATRRVADTSTPYNRPTTPEHYIMLYTVVHGADYVLLASKSQLAQHDRFADQTLPTIVNDRQR